MPEPIETTDEERVTTNEERTPAERRPRGVINRARDRIRQLFGRRR